MSRETKLELLALISILSEFSVAFLSYQLSDQISINPISRDINRTFYGMFNVFLSYLKQKRLLEWFFQFLEHKDNVCIFIIETINALREGMEAMDILMKISLEECIQTNKEYFELMYKLTYIFLSPHY